MSKGFIDSYLIEVSYPTDTQKQNELWDVQGIIKNKSNSLFKFDTRNLSKFNEGYGKIGKLSSKADKMVFDNQDKWILVDVEELHSYLKNYKLNVVKLNDLISNIEWNIILPKKSAFVDKGL
jgi:oligoribonuclease NrnB/cAMP/cGMP phosphodiesterase (DHH superfamily)